jgi:outer membrane receptor protein involved in Fe transport
MRQPLVASALASIVLLSRLALGQTPATPPAPGPDAVEEMPEEEEPSVKPDKSHGVLSGKVTDSAGEDVADAQVSVVGTNFRATSDFEGKFSIKLPPGAYVLRVFYPGLKASRVENLRVTAGQITRVPVTLASDKKSREVEELVVEVEPDRTTAATQLLVRKKSATVSDAVSAQDIAKTPDRSAADAVKRVVGATVIGNRFVFVRGLGDRYTNSLLNGTPLPSPEPDIQAIPLDIFPVGVLSDLTVIKTFTPDMPGDFAGGSVRLNTRQFPEKFLLSVTGTAGYNSQTTFRKRDSYDGGSTDWLGIDDGARKLPSEIAGAGKLTTTAKSKDELERLGETLPQDGRRNTRVTSPVNHGVSVVVGDKMDVLGRPLGWLVSGAYGRRYELRDEHRSLYFSDQGKLSPRFELDGRRSTEAVTLSSLATVSYQVAKDHRLTTTGLYTRRADDEVLALSGYREENKNAQRIRQTRWLERTLTFLQLGGEHRFAAVNGAEAKWNAFYGVANRDEPNNNQSTYETDLSGIFSVRREDGLTHFFSRQKENQYGGMVDYTQPLGHDPETGPKIKLGGLASFKDRKFQARRFSSVNLRCSDCGPAYALDPAELATPAWIGRAIQAVEDTQATDEYRAEQRVFAGYLMAEALLPGKVRVILGERLEHGAIDLVSRDQFVASNPEVRGGFSATTLLPAVNVVVPLSARMNVRAAASRTVARPQLREFAPFSYPAPDGVQVKGNPALRPSRITNLDLRWEFFPSADEVLAASVFYKSFKDPIESTLLVTTELARTYENAAGAQLVGLELEARHGLGFLADPLRNVSLLGNLSVLSSGVDLPKAQRSLQADSNGDGPFFSGRMMQGQSPFALNVALDWSLETTKTRARVSYNVAGRRIDAVGLAPIPSIYEQPRHVVDLALGQKLGEHVDLKLSGENLLNAPFVFKQGERETTRYTLGSTWWVTATYTL